MNGIGLIIIKLALAGGCLALSLPAWTGCGGTTEDSRHNVQAAAPADDNGIESGWRGNLDEFYEDFANS